jgi:hypothetical protein
MLIANPIYDTIFKYMLEDTDVARRFLSAIIGEEIIALDLRPQEYTTSAERFLVTVYRIDFKAIIKTNLGEQKKVLIELQKAKKRLDIERFRRYLGDNYAKRDEQDGEVFTLPIITIYFLGFTLSVKKPILKITRVYQDATTGEVVEGQDEFIEKLTHDSFVVQIPALPKQTKNKLERLLSVFDQRRIQTDLGERMLSFPTPDDDPEDEDLRRVVRRLALAAESEDVREQARMEEELEVSLERVISENDQKMQEINREIEQMNRTLEEKDRTLEEKDRTLEEKDQTIQNMAQQLAELRKQLPHA